MEKSLTQYSAGLLTTLINHIEEISFVKLSALEFKLMGIILLFDREAGEINVIFRILDI